MASLINIKMIMFTFASSLRLLIGSLNTTIHQTHSHDLWTQDAIIIQG